jgi:phosphate transport system substrate-binding protein
MDGEMVTNPNTTWADVNADLPAEEILAFIPGTKHGTREVFEEKVLLQGCEDTGAMAAMEEMGMDEDSIEEACMNVRDDGASVDIDGDYTETLARVDANANGIGVFGLAFYENNTDVLKVATMGGVAPSTESIASGEYPVSRPLYFYVKAAHIGVIPGLKEYAQFFMADEIAGPDGPLAQYGLVADPELAATQAMIEAEETMQ